MPRMIDAIVIHCSASKNGQRVTAAEIDIWHAARGFRRAQEWRDRMNPELGSIGYHFVIHLNGAIATGRHLDEIGAHVQGSNARSIGVCIVGTDKFTPEQWASLAANVRALQRHRPHARVLGHRDYSPDRDGDGVVEEWEWLKKCPGFDVAAWLGNGMKPAVAHLLVPEPANDATVTEPPEAA